MERRQFTRAEYHVEAIVEHRGRRVPCEIENLSLNGAYLRAADPVGADEDVEIEFSLVGSATPLVRIAGRTTRKDPDGMGVQFGQMDLEALARLRSIISANSPDPDTITDELARFAERKCHRGGGQGG